MFKFLERNIPYPPKPPDNSALSQLLRSSEQCDCREWFVEPFVSREQWAFILGVNNATLYRWQAVILSDRLLSILYNSSKGRRFTSHQGLILLVFSRLKRHLTYGEVVEAFRKPLDGKPLWWYLQLGSFEQWLNNK